MSEEPPLPGVLAEIEEIAGREAALGITLAHGGKEIHVPRDLYKTPQGRALADLAGAVAAEAIARRFGGETLHLPLARRALVRHLGSQGLGTAEIAARLRISRRTARRYRRNAPTRTA